MPRDDSWEKIREKREQEDAQDRKLRDAKKRGPHWAGRSEALPEDAALSEKFSELVKRVEPLLEQVNTLYNQYFGGAERTPPIERRKALEQLVYSLSMMRKPTLLEQFQYQSIRSQFISYSERWDRLLKKLETGDGKAFSSRRKRF